MTKFRRFNNNPEEQFKLEFIKDNTKIPSITTIDPASIQEEIIFHWFDVYDQYFTDNFPKTNNFEYVYIASYSPIDITETVNAVLNADNWGIESEDGEYYISSEDENYIIATEV